MFYFLLMPPSSRSFHCLPLFLLLESVPAYGGPVEDVEDAEQNGEEDEECEVGDGVVVLLLLGPGELPHLHLEEDAGVLHQGGEHKDNAGDQPRLDGSQAVCLELKQEHIYTKIHVALEIELPVADCSIIKNAQNTVTLSDLFRYINFQQKRWELREFLSV